MSLMLSLAVACFGLAWIADRRQRARAGVAPPRVPLKIELTRGRILRDD